MIKQSKIITLLLIVTISIYLAIFQMGDNFKMIVCNVGQGDAILIQNKTTQILIDGGPDTSVLNCLGKHMPFWDRQIEVVINTHPEADHYTGLIDVFKNYNVSNFISNGAISSSQKYQVLKSLVGGEGSRELVVNKGSVVKVGLIYLDILSPEQPDQFNKVNNNGLVMLLKYNEFEALLTADVEQMVSNLIAEESKIQNIEYIKVNHHGSKNGMTEKLLKQVNPQVALISVGYKNRYGHPDAEIIDLLKKYNLKILRTDEVEDIVINYK